MVEVNDSCTNLFVSLPKTKLALTPMVEAIYCCHGTITLIARQSVDLNDKEVVSI